MDLPSISATQPNILFISIDDLNDWVNVFEGYPGVKTPNIDKLAQRGTAFMNAQSPIPSCNGARTATLTGLHPIKTGVYSNFQDWRDILPDVTTLPEHFSGNGYKTVGAGKVFHPFFNKPEVFDTYFERPPELLPERTANAPFPYGKVDGSFSDLRDAQVGEFASDFLQQEHESPFFFALGISKVHPPLGVPQEYLDMYPLDSIQLPQIRNDDLLDVPEIGQGLALQKAHNSIVETDQYKAIVQAYLASITYVDDVIGNVLDSLEDSSYADNTVVALWSDHGFHLGEKLHWGKESLWEEAARVPLIISGGGLNQDQSVSKAVSLVDLYPTLSELAGISVSPELDGNSLVPLLENPSMDWDAPAVTFWENSYSLRTEQWRYIQYYDGSQELYDHYSDPNEFNNLANDSEYSDVISDLSATLDDFISESPFHPMVGTAQDDQLIGTEGQDIIIGSGGNDRLQGNAGSDRLHDAVGNDTLIGGAGNDYIEDRQGNNKLYGGSGNDSLAAYGQESSSLYGGIGDDNLYAGTDDDYLDGGQGQDFMRGGLGSNTYVVDNSDDQISAFGTKAYDKVLSSISWAIDSKSGVEDLTLIGQAENGTGNQRNNKIQGNQIDNFIDGQHGSDLLLGSSGDDTLFGGGKNDILVGGSGDDILNGGRGLDTGRQSADANFTLTNSSLVGAGIDSITSIERFMIAGGNSDNHIDARQFTKGTVSLYGKSGDDDIRGGKSNDLLLGGDGNDTLAGSDGDDNIFGGSGIDFLIGSRLHNPAGQEIDTLIGGQDQDRFVLGSRTNVFYRNDGNMDLSYAVIQDFEVVDRLILTGIQSDYQIRQSSTGVHILFQHDSSLDQIALIQGQINLSLGSPQIIFR